MNRDAQVTTSRTETLIFPTEIWSDVGSKISSLSTVNELSLTCKAFYSIFSPLLFENRIVQLNRWNPAKLSAGRKCLPPGLEHTKELGILLNEWRGGELEYYEEKNPRYGKFIGAMVASMPKLHSFWWDDQAFEDYNPALILRYKKLLFVLSSAPNLKKLSFSFSQQFLDSHQDAKRSFIYLDAFKNLTSLELYHFYGNRKRLVKNISGVLSRSPALNTLGLAMACDADCYGVPEIMILDSDCDFIEKLCREFATLGSEPLTLHTLKLGFDMVITDPVEGNDNHLDLLFKTKNLHTLHIFNGLIKFDSPEEDEEDLDVAWDLLKGCTSLHQLAVTRLDKEAGAWLNKTAKNLKQLIITEHSGMDGRTQRILPTLDHHLTLLLAPESGYWKDTEEAWSDTDSSEADSDDSSDLPIPEATETEARDLDVEALTERMQENTIDDKVATVLDRLKDNGSHLTELSISLDFSVQWDNFISRLLNLKTLTHLYLEPRNRQYGGEALHHDNETARDHGAKQAKQLKLACPSLQFIRIDKWAWQIIAQRNHSKITKDDVNSCFELVDMDWNEIFNIESFAIDPVNTQSGLPKKRLVPPMDFWDDDGGSEGVTEDDSDEDDWGGGRGWYRADEL